MHSLSIERDTEILIDNQLKNLGWLNDPHAQNRNVYQQRVKTDAQKRLLLGKRPDYILYPTDASEPLAVIEAKRQGQNIHDALMQGLAYAEILHAPIVFATDGVFTKTLHVKAKKPLMLNGEEVDELMREQLALKFSTSNEISTLDKRVIKSRGELISIFGTVNNLLREEGLQRGIERFTEFSNILFLKVLSEIEDGKEERGERSKIDAAYRWDYFKNKKGRELLSYVSDTVLQWFSREYKDENIFQPLQIKHPDNLKEIINLLDGLQLTDINADVKGDAFEYFIRSYSASNPSDLGEIFTPRHVVKAMVRMVRPEIGEKVYDPFCGTGGMLIVAFKHLMDTMPRNARNMDTLRRHTIYGADLTKSASIAKMNMILAGDGHNNVRRLDSLANPVDDKYEIVLTNMPFAQKTRFGDKYAIPNRNGDVVCSQHCFRALKEGGRMAIIVPEGFLSNPGQAFIDVRRFLLENATLKNIVSLPHGAFEPYNRAKADILYFTDVKQSKTKSHFWFFDVKNDGYTLDKKRSPIPGPNDLELVLSEKSPDTQPEEYLAKLGITKIDLKTIKGNDYILQASQYRELVEYAGFKYPIFTFEDLFDAAGQDRIGPDDAEAPLMSITMDRGLIDQKEKFKKRIASADISKYKKVYKNELVVGFPIDEGVIGFQFRHKYAAVSPAYHIWKLKQDAPAVHLKFLDMFLRSLVMRSIYDAKKQGVVDRRRSMPKNVFLRIRIPIPPIEMQQQLIKRHAEIEAANQKIKAIEGEIAQGFKGLWEKEGVMEDFDEGAEDALDLKTADERIAAISKNPSSLISGDALAKRLAKFDK